MFKNPGASWFEQHWCLYSNVMSFFTLCALENGSSSLGRAFTSPVISSVSRHFCLPPLMLPTPLFPPPPLCPEQWGTAVIAHCLCVPHRLFCVTSFLYGILCFIVIMPVPGNLFSCTTTLLSPDCVFPFWPLYLLVFFFLRLGISSSLLLAVILLLFSSLSPVFSPGRTVDHAYCSNW